MYFEYIIEEQTNRYQGLRNKVIPDYVVENK